MDQGPQVIGQTAGAAGTAGTARHTLPSLNNTTRYAVRKSNVIVDVRRLTKLHRDRQAALRR